jgi:ketosteroid isomerase-like protein
MTAGRIHGAWLAAVLLMCSGGARDTAAQTGHDGWSEAQQEVIDAALAGPVGLESDFEGWAGGYSAEWTYWRIGDPEVRDRATHMGLVRGVIEGGNRVVAFEAEPMDVVVRGDVALIRLNAVETLASPEGERRTVRYSTATMYVREYGRWRALATNIFYPTE